MEILGYLIHKERTARKWSLEALGHGICTPSYLSKIETGKTSPSQEILVQLLKKMGLEYTEIGTCSWQECLISELFEILTSHDRDSFGYGREKVQELQNSLYSEKYVSIRLLEQLYEPHPKALEKELEPFMTTEELAWQRLLQHRFSDAIRLKPYIVFYLREGIDLFNKGSYIPAIEPLTQAFQSAGMKGYFHIMLYSSIFLGYIYGYESDLQRMTSQYKVTKRMAKAMHNEKILSYINYHLATAYMEMGKLDQAWRYFGREDNFGSLSLHKKAICLEKMQRTEEAKKALHQAYEKLEMKIDTDARPEHIKRMLDIVQYRLDYPDKSYLVLAESDIKIAISALYKDFFSSIWYNISVKSAL